MIDPVRFYLFFLHVEKYLQNFRALWARFLKYKEHGFVIFIAPQAFFFKTLLSKYYYFRYFLHLNVFFRRPIHENNVT